MLAWEGLPGTPEMRSKATRCGRLNDCVKMLMAGSVLEAVWDPVPVPPRVWVLGKSPSGCDRDGCRSVSADCRGAPAGLERAAGVERSGMDEGAVAHAWDA